MTPNSSGEAAASSFSVKSGGRHSGIGPWLMALWAILIAAAVISRKPHLVYQAEFFGDEANWFHDAYVLGAWREVFQPQGGYLCLLSKLLLPIAVHVPLHVAPILFGAYTVLLETLVAVYLLTSRLDRAASLPARAVLGVLFVILPNSGEVLSLNETQWILAVLAFLIIISTPPTTAAWKTFDVVWLGLIALTGPFCILLLPVAAVFWYIRRFRWTLLLMGVLAVGSCVQVVTLSHALHACKPQAVLNASGLRVLAGQLFLFGTLDGGRLIPGAPFGSSSAFVIAVLVTLIAVSAVGYGLLRGPIELKLLLAFSGLVLVSSIRRMYCDGGWKWDEVMLPFFVVRYWYIERMGMFALLAWLAGQQRLSGVRVLSATAIWLVVLDSVMHWQYPPPYNLNFEVRSREFDQGPPGTTVTIWLPPGETITLVKH